MDALLDQLRTELAGRYEVGREIGRGGMAVVYLARDLKHERRVALKVLRPELVGEAAADRFLREIQTAAQLHHPHILQLYDSGTAGVALFYVMPYVDGESLRERLDRSGPLPVEEAVRFTREVADALDYAHRRDVVHRDIKPENILLSAGHALVADFGIARAIDATGLKLTDTGVALGTPMYMSPEQAAADPKVDGRADQYALGCVLYEMLAGHPPFTGSSSQAVMARHAHDPVSPLRTVRAVPAMLEVVIQRALAKAPADRWPTAAEFADQLHAALRGAKSAEGSRVSRRRIIPFAAAAAVILLAIVGWVAAQWSRADDQRAIGDGLRLVAVLPFASTGDTAEAALAAGLTEGVTAGLVQVRGLGVLSAGRVQAHSEQSEDPRETGRKLGVSAVVTANVRLAGNRMRISPKLIDVASGRTLWQQQFYGEMVLDDQVQDIWSIIDNTTLQIVSALRPELARTGNTPGARGIRTTDPEAFRLYLEAYRAPWTATGTRRAIVLLEEALRRDSSFADAWAALGDRFINSPQDLGRSATPVDRAINAHRMIEKAIELDLQNAKAYAARGIYRMMYEWDWDGAIRDLRRAGDLNPAAASVAFDLATAFAFLNQRDSSLSYARRGVALDPADPMSWNLMGKVYAFAGMVDSALVASERSVALDPGNWSTYFVLMNGYLDAGRRADADRAADRMVSYDEGPNSLAYAASYYRRAGNHKAARDMLSRLQQIRRERYVPPSAFGAVLLASGDVSGALSALEEGARIRDLNLVNHLLLNYTPLRGHPRFEAVRSRVSGGRNLMRSPFR